MRYILFILLALSALLALPKIQQSPIANLAWQYEGKIVSERMYIGDEQPQRLPDTDIVVRIRAKVPIHVQEADTKMYYDLNVDEVVYLPPGRYTVFPRNSKSAFCYFESKMQDL